MSPDSVTRVTSTSWFGRIGNAFKGVLVGLILFVLAFPMLFWNEGRAIRTFKSLKEGAGAVVSVPAEPVDPANEGKLVHVSGRAETLEVLEDASFGVRAPALKLRRHVEMYQWKESRSSKTRQKLGGGEETVTTYTYAKTWSDDLIDSSRFEVPDGHRNPEQMAYRSHEVEAARVTLGDFTLSSSLLAKLQGGDPLPLPGDYALPESLKGRAARNGDRLFVGRDPASPEVGDLRISFSVVRPQEISVVSQQAGASFQPYPTKAGTPVDLLQCGIVGAAEMFTHAQNVNRMITWLLRFGGFLLMTLGLVIVFKPLSVLADVVPLFGAIARTGVGLISLVIGASLTLVTVAVAWLTYRPLLAGCLLAGALVLVLLGRKRSKKAPAAA